MELINKFDNALGGVAGDSGETGVVVNGGNKLATGKFWQMQHCTGPPDEHDKQQPGVYDHDENDILSHLIEQFLPLGVGAGLPDRLELQRARPHRPRRPRRPQADAEPDHHRPGPPQREGAQERDGPDRGGALLRRRVEPQLEHVRRDPADLQGGRRCHADAGLRARVDQDLEEDEVAARQALLLRLRLRRRSERPGVADTEPREGVSYPFKSFDGKVTFERQRSGERLFDFSKDGVAHYGMFPDWWEDIRTTPGGPAVIRDMARGAEAYLQEWERVYGIRHGCKSRLKRITRRGVAHVRLRGTARLSCSGAPASRRCAATTAGAGACAARRTATASSRRR